MTKYSLYFDNKKVGIFYFNSVGSATHTQIEIKLYSEYKGLGDFFTTGIDELFKLMELKVINPTHSNKGKKVKGKTRQNLTTYAKIGRGIKPKFIEIK